MAYGRRSCCPYQYFSRIVANSLDAAPDQLPTHPQLSTATEAQLAISLQPTMLSSLEHFFASRLGHLEVFADHMEHPVSRRITAIALTGLIAILIYKLVFQVGVWLGLWEIPGKEYFEDTPTHCAHVYVEVHAVLNGEAVLTRPLKYHIEFSPEEYNTDDPDLGSTLGFLRKKCYFLFKDSSVFEDLQPTRYTFDDVEIYTKSGVLLVEDEKPLCLHGVETGQKLKVLAKMEKEE